MVIEIVQRRFAGLALIFSTAAASSLFVYLRVSSVLPTVFGDELVYQKMSYLDSYDVYLGNGLFSRLMSFTQQYGLDFYLQVKLVNAFFVGVFGIAVGVYALTRLSAGAAVLLTIAATVGPAGVYSSFFMPETVFFGLLSWAMVLLTFLESSVSTKTRFALLLASGFFFSLASITKPHALLVLPVVVVFLFLMNGARARSALIAAIYGVLVVASNVVLTELIAPGKPALLAGYAPNGLDSILGIAGTLSGSNSSDDILATSALINGQLGLPIAQFLGFQIFAFSLVSILAVGVSIAALAFIPGRQISDYFFATVMIWLIVVITLFSLYLTTSGDDHSDRLLLRYIEWIFIFVLIDGLYRIRGYSQSGTLLPMAVRVAPIAQLLAVIVYPLLAFDTQVSDSIFASGLVLSLDSPWFVALASLTMLYVLLRYPTKSYQAILLGSAGMFVALGLSAQQYQIDVNGAPVSSDDAGIYLYREFPDGLDSPLLILGSDQTLNQSAIFWSQEFESRLQITSASRVIEVSESEQLQYVLALDEISLVESDYVEIVHDGKTFKLYLVKEIPN